MDKLESGLYCREQFYHPIGPVASFDRSETGLRQISLVLSLQSLFLVFDYSKKPNEPSAEDSCGLAEIEQIKTTPRLEDPVVERAYEDE